MRIPARKTPGDSLQEEIQKEKAEVLGRAGEMLADAIAELSAAEEDINRQVRSIRELAAQCESEIELRRRRQKAIREINSEIDRYNELRGHAELRYYYLIVTREAMGLRRHDRVREIYVIPERKRRLHVGGG